MSISGYARVDVRTKDVVARLQPNDIAVIQHEDIDEVAAQSLIEARVRAVFNAAPSVTGRYPNRGPYMLVEAGIPLVDVTGERVMQRIADDDTVTFRAGAVFCNGEWVGKGVLRTAEDLHHQLQRGWKNLEHEIERFVENTLDYAYREKELFSHVRIPVLRTELQQRTVLVVVRGQSYKEDLRVLRPYVQENRPVLIGVDGGADALAEAGYTPDIIVGDMDSVSDEILQCGAEVVVHAYPNGKAPGLARVRALGLQAKVIQSPGTSEDVALWIAHEKEAELIVAVGTHSNIIDFLEKGRSGMASTFLVRLRVGAKLFDAKGVSRLYQPARRNYVAEITAAASLPFIILWSLSAPAKQWFALLWLQLRLLTGW